MKYDAKVVEGYLSNKTFRLGFDIPHSSGYSSIYKILKMAKKHKDERTVIVGAAASLFMQGLNVAAKALLQESEIEFSKKERDVLNYSAVGGEILLEHNNRHAFTEEKADDFTDQFLKKINIKPTIKP